MDVIRISNEFSIRQLGGFLIRTKGKLYRLNKFCFIHHIDEGVLVVNNLTGAFVRLRDIEYSNIYTEDPCNYVDFLVLNYFLVPINYDEELALKTIRNGFTNPLIDTYLDHPTGFTILTTSACNARCFYCYELGLKNKVHMSLETAEKVAKYIIGCTPRGGEVALDWFGGEPLFNHKVIDIIISRIASADIPYRSSMISNGYLFDDKLVRKAKNEWKLKNVQITLDGTEDVYNKTKSYIYKDCESPFKRVIENMHKLIDADIYVSVRINIDKHNYDNLTELANFLSEEFKGCKGFSVYAHTVFEEGFKRTDEETAEIYSNLTKLERLLNDLGIFGGYRSGGEVKGLHCMVDDGKHVCIFPKGEIGVCEHYLDKYFVSHIENPNEKNWEVLKMWRNYVPQIGICESCTLKPVCLKVGYCPDEEECDKYQLEYEMNKFKMSMEHEYKQFLEMQQEGNSCSCATRLNCPQHTPYCSQHTEPNNNGNNEGSQWLRVYADGRVEPVKTY